MRNPIVLVDGLAALLCLGCAGARGLLGPTAERQDAAPRLALLLQHWKELKASGQTCEDLPRAGQPERDCGRIQLGLRRLGAEFPHEPSVLMANAVVSYEVGHPTRSQAYLDTLLALRPGHAEATLLRSRIASEEGNLPFARRLLRDSIELSPAHPGLREAAASVAYLAGDLPEAQRHLRAAERLGAPGWRVAYHRGVVAEAADDPSAAAAHYRRSLELRPDYERARARLAGLSVAP